MSDDNKKRPRKTRDISTELEEENLWDLEDDWDDEETDDSAAPSADPVEEESSPAEEDTAAEKKDDVPAAETADDADPAPPATEEEPTEDDELETDEDTLLVEDEPADLDLPIDVEPDSEPEIDQPEEAPEPIPAKPIPDPGQDTEQVSTEPEPAAPDADATPSESPVATAAMAVKKLSLSPVEKITLIALGVCMLGLLTWGCFWLAEKNRIADTRETVELPVEGKHATVTELSTFWISPEKKSGVNLNAVIVPAVSITLDDASGQSGALRIYFRNEDKDSVGDTITLQYKNGKFSDGSSSIEVSASDGFHTEGRFHAYQVDAGTPWRVIILEAPSINSPGSEFKPLIDAPVDAVRR